MPMSPVALDAVVLVGVAAAVLALLLLLLELLLLPQAASTNAPKLAAPALPAIFRKRLRSTSSRTSRSTIPAGWGASSSGELSILGYLRLMTSRAGTRLPRTSGALSHHLGALSHRLADSSRTNDPRVNRTARFHQHTGYAAPTN